MPAHHREELHIVVVGSQLLVMVEELVMVFLPVAVAQREQQGCCSDLTWQCQLVGKRE